MNKNTFLFFLLLLTLGLPLSWAKVEVKGSPSLASYAERRGSWSLFVGAGNLQNTFGTWEDNVTFDMAIRHRIAQTIFDVGAIYKHQIFPHDYRQNALGLGMWASRIWSEPYVVPFFALGQSFPSKDISSFLTYQVGALFGLSWLEADSYFRLREEMGVEHVYLDISYFNSLDNHVEFSGYSLGIKVEW
ncbi:MAG: hypothetical protein N2Z70_00345 [Bdellovibrionaceae bacterium]|jgi:hypothetical protein|nr:hypothetical protein [Pseudobdellovibrionaceae bacterium]